MQMKPKENKDKSSQMRKPALWAYILVVLILMVVLPAYIGYRRRERQPARQSER